MKSNDLVSIFNLKFSRVTLNHAVVLLIQEIKSNSKSLVVTPNVDQIVQLEQKPEIRHIYNQAAFVFVDGMPIVWFSKLLPKKYHLPERINGTNLMEKTCEAAALQAFSIALIGGKEGAARTASEVLRQRYPGLRISGYACPPYGFEHDPKENEKLVSMIAAWEPDFLFVGVGNPKQEKWIFDNWKSLHFKVAMGIGSAIELIAGQVVKGADMDAKVWLGMVLEVSTRTWKTLAKIFRSRLEISSHSLT